MVDQTDIPMHEIDNLNLGAGGSKLRALWPHTPLGYNMNITYPLMGTLCGGEYRIQWFMNARNIAKF